MANQEQLELLMMGVTAWNTWRQEHSDEKIDLSETDFKGYDLSGANLTKANLRGCNFSAVDLRTTDLVGSDLTEADLNRANLTEVNLRECNFSSADLMEANLRGAILVRATLEETLLNKACLKGAYLYRANLKDAILIGVDLEEADLERSDMSGALLYEANLKGAYLYAAILKGTKLRRANLEGADLREGHLEGADLQRATLGGNETLPLTNLRNVFFDEATNLRDITLGNMKHGFVRLADVHWSNVNLAVINWDPIAMLGDERDAHQCRKQRVSWMVQLTMLQQAIRANHQLVAILQDQAMLEEADYFGYRTQVLHRKVLQLQFLLQLVRLWEKLQGTRVWGLFGWISQWLRRTWMWKVAAQIGRGIIELWHWFQRTWIWKAVLEIGQGIYRLWCWFQTTWVWKIIVKLGRVVSGLWLWLLGLGGMLRKGGSIIFALFLGLLAGYGYKPERTFLCYLLVVFGFAGIYHEFYHIQSFLDALVLSLTSLHGRGFFPGILSGNPLIEPTAPLAVVEAIIGLMIEISFVATFTRRFFGK